MMSLRKARVNNGKRQINQKERADKHDGQEKHKGVITI
jgi:hypothetical protein